MLLTLILISIISFSVFASEKPTIRNIQFSTGSSEGTWIQIGAGICEKANDYVQGFPFTAVPGPGSIGNPALVHIGGADVGISYGPFLLMAKNAELPFEEEITNLRAIGTLTPTIAQFVCSADISGESVEEVIKNKSKIRLGVAPPGQGDNIVFRKIYREMGYSKLEDISKDGSKVHYDAASGLVPAYKDRFIDLHCSLYNLPASSVEECFVSRKSKLLNIGENLGKKMVENHSFLDYVIPAGTYKGQNEDIHTIGLPMTIFVNKDIPDEAAYFLAKAMYENKEYLVNVHPSFKSFEPEKITMGVGVDLHPGAIKYYKEVGLLK